MLILFISPFPIDKPIHGGQIRLANIVNYYKKNGYNTFTVGLSRNYPPAKGFIDEIDYSVIRKYSKDFAAIEDWALGQVFQNEDYYYNKLKEQISTIPDIIFVQHPWLFGFAERFVEDIGYKIPIIYDSNNIEFLLKKAILEEYYKKQNSSVILSYVKETEEEAIINADGVTCVSQNDLNYIKNYSNNPILLAPNGVSEKETTEDYLLKVDNISGKQPYVFFCGSAHPPNAQGFFDMLSGGFGCLNHDMKLIVAGGVKDLIINDPRFKEIPKLEEKTTLLGVVDEKLITALVKKAHCIILPITSGGGTNLKTAEALWSGNYVVATKLAMRGFEQFLDAPGVFIGDDSGSFKRAIRHAMELSPLTLSDIEKNKRKVVLWDSCLNGLIQFTEDVFKRAKGQKLNFKKKERHICIPDFFETKYKQYRLGELFYSSEEESPDGTFIYGLSNSEKAFTWTDGKRIEFHFKIENTQASIIHALFNLAMIFQNKQNVLIFINKEKIDNVLLDVKSNLEFDFLCPKDGIVDLVLELPDATSPYSIGMSQDKRVLALAIKSIIFSEKKPRRKLSCWNRILSRFNSKNKGNIGDTL